MLNFIRKHAQSWVIKVVLWLVVFAFIGTIFLVWGRGRGGIEDQYVARVKGEPISVKEYQNAYNQLFNLYKQIYKDMNEELLKTLNLKEMALDRLIQEKLLLSEAHRLGLTVMDQELLERLEKYPVFQENGVFNRQRYLEVLRLNRIEPTAFERGERQAVLIGKVGQIIKDSVKVSEREIRDHYLVEKEQVKVEYLSLKPELFKAQAVVSNEEVERYYQDNKEDFKKPEAVKVKYVFIDPKQFLGRTKVDDEEVKGYYEKHKDEYEEEERIKARHILITLPEDSGEEKSAAAKKRIEEIAQEIKAGGDFAELARKYSEDPGSASKGGDLGYFSRDTMVKPFSDAAFNLKVGEVSEPVKSNFGYHLIKLEDKKVAQHKEFEQVKEEILTHLEEQKAQVLFEEQMDTMTNQSYNMNLKELAQRNSLEVKETPFFEKTTAIPDIGFNPEFNRIAFSLEKGSLSEKVKTAKGYYFVELVEKREAYLPLLEEIRASVEDAVKLVKAKKVAKEKGEALIDRIKKGEKLENLAEEAKIKLQNTDFFNRMRQSLPNIGSSKEFIQTSFSLTDGEVKLVENSKGVFLLRLLERKKPTEDEFQKEKGNYAKQVLTAKQEQVYTGWIEQLKEKAKARGELTISDKIS